MTPTATEASFLKVLYTCYFLVMIKYAFVMIHILLVCPTSLLVPWPDFGVRVRLLTWVSCDTTVQKTTTHCKYCVFMIGAVVYTSFQQKLIMKFICRLACCYEVAMLEVSGCLTNRILSLSTYLVLWNLMV